jgi:hypothetical protein
MWRDNATAVRHCATGRSDGGPRHAALQPSLRAHSVAKRPIGVRLETAAKVQGPQASLWLVRPPSPVPGLCKRV